MRFNVWLRRTSANWSKQLTSSSICTEENCAGDYETFWEVLEVSATSKIRAQDIPKDLKHREVGMYQDQFYIHYAEGQFYTYGRIRIGSFFLLYYVTSCSLNLKLRYYSNKGIR